MSKFKISTTQLVQNLNSSKRHLDYAEGELLTYVNLIRMVEPLIKSTKPEKLAEGAALINLILKRIFPEFEKVQNFVLQDLKKRDDQSLTDAPLNFVMDGLKIKGDDLIGKFSLNTYLIYVSCVAKGISEGTIELNQVRQRSSAK